MAEQTRLMINGDVVMVESPPDTPLLYVLIDELKMKGPRFGCGLAQCGSCSVLVDGTEIRSCVTPLATLTNKSVTTLEGLPEKYALENGLESVPQFTPVQNAFISEQAIQCGYCFNGMIIKATELLDNNPNPSSAEIKTAMNGHLCRCGTYPKIIKAILSAAQTMRDATQEQDQA